MEKKYLIAATSAALLLSAVSCGNQTATEPSAGKAEPLAQLVEIQPATLQDVPYTTVYSSTVQANIVNNIAPQSMGRITKVNVEIGDFVNAGQILAEMDKVNLLQAELKLKNAADELERVRTLLTEGGISQSDFDQMELNYRVSKSAYENLLENTVLRSPVTGVVTARNYDKGDMYSASAPLFTIQQIVPVKLLVSISESDYTRVRKGDKVTVTADALPGKTFEGKISRIYPTIDPATHTFNVEVRVHNEKKELRPGMFARATVDFGTARSIVLPDQALVKMQGAGVRSVFVLQSDSTVVSKVVTPGRHFDSKCEILDGISVGDQIVVKGASTLKAGDKVRVK